MTATCQQEWPCPITPSHLDKVCCKKEAANRRKNLTRGPSADWRDVKATTNTSEISRGRFWKSHQRKTKSGIQSTEDLDIKDCIWIALVPMCVLVCTHMRVCVCVCGYTCLSVCACVFRIFCCWYNSLLVSTRGTAVVEHDNISEIRYEIAEAQQLTSSSFRYRGIQ